MARDRYEATFPVRWQQPSSAVLMPPQSFSNSDETSLEPYQYTPIDTKAGQIRLLRLSPRNVRPLRIQIQVADMEAWWTRGEGPPKYDALSYTWGEATQLRSLLVDNSDHNASNSYLRITSNLAEALPYLQLEDEWRTMWIDSICINQANHIERAQQVAAMGQIFLSGRVIVWLGPPRDDSRFALKILRFVSSRHRVNNEALTFQAIRPDPHRKWQPWEKSAEDNLVLEDNLKADTREARAMAALYNRPWFERLWVRQELFFGEQHAILYCGRHRIPWSILAPAILIIDSKLSHTSSKAQVSDWTAKSKLVASLREVAINGTYSVHYFMSDRAIKCSNPLDKVYGCINMSNRLRKAVGEGRLTIDYDKSPLTLFRELVLEDLQIYHDADFLINCGANQDNRFPSWVPDLTHGLPPEHIGPWCIPFAAASTSVSLKQVDDQVLRLEGRLVTRIAERHPLDPDYSQPVPEKGRYACLHKALERTNPDAPYIGGGTIRDAIAQLLFAELINRRRLRSFTRKTPVVLEDLIATINHYTWPTRDFVQHAKQIAEICADMDMFLSTQHSGRSLIITEDGYLGLTGSPAQPGDVICVILGARAPVILRPHPSDTFAVIGPCSTAGLNAGEGLLGKLPEGFDIIHLAYEGLKFLDRRKDELSFFDPRVQWEELKIDNPEGIGVGKSIRGEDGQYFKRPDLEYFRRHGVALRAFDLV